MVQGVDTYAGSITTRTQPDEMQVAPTLVPVFADESPPVADVLVAIPAYNEERFIGSVVHGVRMEGFDCVVVDDGSTDRTAEIATAAGAVVHTLPENRGKSEAVALAIKTALRMEVETLVLMDGDWQHDPREIHGLLVPIRAGVAEIVSGSRFLNGPQRSVPRVRGVGLWAMTAMTNAAVGARITDSQTGFRAFSRRALETLSFSSDGFSVEVEVQFMAQARGLTHVEVPITARYDDPPKRNVLGQAARVTDGRSGSSRTTDRSSSSACRASCCSSLVWLSAASSSAHTSSRASSPAVCPPRDPADHPRLDRDVRRVVVTRPPRDLPPARTAAPGHDQGHRGAARSTVCRPRVACGTASLPFGPCRRRHRHVQRRTLDRSVS